MLKIDYFIARAYCLPSTPRSQLNVIKCGNPLHHHPPPFPDAHKDGGPPVPSHRVACALLQADSSPESIIPALPLTAFNPRAGVARSGGRTCQAVGTGPAGPHAHGGGAGRGMSAGYHPTQPPAGRICAACGQPAAVCVCPCMSVGVRAPARTHPRVHSLKIKPLARQQFRVVCFWIGAFVFIAQVAALPDHGPLAEVAYI